MKNTKPDLSVIICTEGKRESLKKTLESILVLDVSIQVVIVTPLTFEVLNSLVKESNLGKISFQHVKDEGIGIYEAMNLGIEKASSRYTIFLNDDDKFLAEARILGGYLREQEYIDAYLAPVNLVSPSGLSTRIGKVLDLDSIKFGRMPTSHQGQIWGTLFLRNMSGYNTKICFGLIKFQLRVCADFEFYVRATSNKPHFRILSLPIVEAELGGFSDTHPHRRMFETFLVLLRYRIHNPVSCLLYLIRFEVSYFLQRIK
jgi:glycosyltransferase involved in cell wall biosynthesis